jgi:ABC-2 type transport system permease protein
MAFAGIGLSLAGRLRAEVNLAAQNGLYLVLLLTSGMILDPESMPEQLNSISRWFPAQPLAELLRSNLSDVSADLRPWVVLLCWALAAPLLASRLFRWSGNN